MSRRGRILQELGLSPLWVRHETLANWQTQYASAPPDLASGPPTAPAPVPQASPAPPIAEPVKRPRTPPVVVTPTARSAPPVEAPLLTSSPRVDEIGTLDWAGLQQHVGACRACGLCDSRTQTVFGVGARHADLMVIGEAPGAEEDRRGEPFVGDAGRLLDQMLAAIGERRGDRVFIANVLKCRPPGNRNPQPAEVAECAPYLLRQIALVQPKVIFLVGRFAIQTVLGSTAPVGALRGQMHHVNGIPTVVSYHPAYLLRNLPDKARAWQDLLLVKAALEQSAPR
ncbi:uracil-DNA glycosylase family protein [Chitinibacteraceae bacterium HSL-7]